MRYLENEQVLITIQVTTRCPACHGLEVSLHACPTSAKSHKMG